MFKADISFTKTNENYIFLVPTKQKSSEIKQTSANVKIFFNNKKTVSLFNLRQNLH